MTVRIEISIAADPEGDQAAINEADLIPKSLESRSAPGVFEGRVKRHNTVLTSNRPDLTLQVAIE